ncbi:VanZ family protein [Streptomyces pathocidini]|uniref:VanZ family protein n=2 Tax=Streptomyces pathocidini TaxID=1650571 RepID=A0ABW7UWT7_9ACTN
MQRHRPNDRPTARSRATGLVLLAAYLLFVGWLTLRPRYVPWVPAANLHPFATVRAELAEGPWHALLQLGPSLLLLAPLGVLLPMVTGRLWGGLLGSLAHTVSSGAMVSLAIELLQTDVPGRTLDVDVLLLNTAGVAAAHLLLTPLLAARLDACRAGQGAGCGTSRGSGRGTGGGDGRGQGGPGRGPGQRRAAVRRDEGSQGPTPTIPRVGIAP